MKARSKTLELTYMAIGAALIAICSWISIPATIPFTMQTFAVFCIIDFIGGKKGCISILVYILLGAIGIPVFSGFTGGIGVLFGTTGGYIIGFIFIALSYWAMTNYLGFGLSIRIISLIIGLVVCYIFGTAWFMILYTHRNENIALSTALGWCVIPFIIPDLIKLALAITISSRIKKLLHFNNM